MFAYWGVFELLCTAPPVCDAEEEKEEEEKN